ncbi:MAG: plasmid mobilization protein [Hydrogenophaga sp.]|jgi:hypothetical protein|uniref:plasmid mobilization protein n=1 Tax=Hydrogenophaga sp. TaxID=1904254 RepID=UPI001D43C55E|nr:hypothetical protein [Hydrogenophaga sp.]MBW0170711.1 hypothetical protein [Hydrogenophaga sp.]MBW0185548.1 hypothetical protein [Hydrogenophaga sp.]
MSERSRFIKVRVSDGEYKDLRQRADVQGLTMSEHVRSTVRTVHDSLDVAAELAALRQLVMQATPSAAVALGHGTGSEHREMLLLLRELAAARDAQILARVRAQLALHGGSLEQRRGAV